MTAVWRSLDEVPADYGPTVVTLGNFDGVHRGHQAVLSTMVSDARDRGQRAVAVTFDPHPLAVHYPDRLLTLITGIADRLDRLCDLALDATLVVEYTLDFAAQTPDEFVKNYFVDGLRAATVVVGKDTKFGANNAGDAQTMRGLGAKYGFEVEVVEEAHGPANGDEREWSSTWIRELLAAGRVADAARVLGRPHRVRGVVVHGNKLGSEIGFPTANIEVTAGMVPAHGVYAGWLMVLASPDGVDTRDVAVYAEHYLGRRLPAAISVGVNSTVGGTEVRVEAHVIGMDDIDLYGSTVALDLVDYRRPMVDLGSIEALTAALAEDVDWAKQVLDQS